MSLLRHLLAFGWPLEMLKALFTKLDKDCDGELSLDELENADPEVVLA